MESFLTEGWNGPESLHFQEKKQRLLDYKKEENNENVKQWIDMFISILDQYIQQAKIKEERFNF